MKYLFFLSATVVSMVLHTTMALGQTEQSTAAQTKSNVPIVMAKTSVKRVGFRLTEWKTVHASSAEHAEQEAAALKKIGCEVTTDNHGSHIDVKYRCPQWKSMKLKDAKLVDQWSSWCIAKGMETIEIDPPATSKKATVQFRLLIPKTVHLHDTDQATQIVTTLKLIGCEVSTNNHGNHIDTTFSCPRWSTIALPTDGSAHSWQTWLDESGFETKHTH